MEGLKKVTQILDQYKHFSVSSGEVTNPKILCIKSGRREDKRIYVITYGTLCGKALKLYRVIANLNTVFRITCYCNRFPMKPTATLYLRGLCVN
jgi:hypothetical protein